MPVRWNHTCFWWGLYDLDGTDVWGIYFRVNGECPVWHDGWVRVLFVGGGMLATALVCYLSYKNQIKKKKKKKRKGGSKKKL